MPSRGRWPRVSHTRFPSRDRASVFHVAELRLSDISEPAAVSLEARVMDATAGERTGRRRAGRRRRYQYSRDTASESIDPPRAETDAAGLPLGTARIETQAFRRLGRSAGWVESGDSNRPGDGEKQPLWGIEPCARSNYGAASSGGSFSASCSSRSWAARRRRSDRGRDRIRRCSRPRVTARRGQPLAWRSPSKRQIRVTIFSRRAGTARSARSMRRMATLPSPPGRTARFSHRPHP